MTLLKQHLLSRLRGASAIGEEEDFSAAELNQIEFHHLRIYNHATAQVNYTTYDVFRDQDTLHVGEHGDKEYIMVASNEEDSSSSQRRHPFWYARVLGIYHANILDRTERFPRPKRMEFLWVRWFGMDPDWVGGPSTLRLDRVGYVPENDPSGAFGFIDPSHVLRACHLIPAFHLGKTTNLLGPSEVRDSTDGDWVNYYVMRSVHTTKIQNHLFMSN